VSAEAVGDYRRRVDTIDELSFIIDSDDFAGVVARLERYGGHTPLLESKKGSATFALSSGILLRIDLASKENWGYSLVRCTGNQLHLRELGVRTGECKTAQKAGPFATESDFYDRFGLSLSIPSCGKDMTRSIVPLAAHCLR
jgi:hypothetical protein